MAVDAATSLAPARPRASLAARVAALPARLVLGALVGVSFAIRWALAGGHSTPYYFPDEYIYATLAHGLATTGAPSVRGATVSFPALLEPLLAAPLWLLGDAERAYALTQGLHALAMSLAAVPVYLLARRLGLGSGTALALGAVAVAAPSLTYASFMLADPIAYPLVLGAIAAGVAALDRPSARLQVAFLGLAGLATFARVQYVVLPLVFVAAAALVERRRALRTYRLTAVALALPVVAAFAVGIERALGYYENVANLELPLGGLARWAGNDSMILAYAAGWLVVPGALVGLAYALARGTRAERGFAALTVGLGAFVIGQAALYSANADVTVARVHERYTMTLVPLLAVAFALWARSGRGRRVVALLALALLALSARVPLASYTIGSGKDDSPTLRAVLRLEQHVGLAEGSLVVAGLAALLSLAAVAVAYRPRALAPAALAATLVTLAALSTGAASFDRLNAGGLRAAQPADRAWVDATGLRDVGLLQLPESVRGRAFEQLFWNRESVTRLLLLGASPIDTFEADHVTVRGRDGALLVAGRPWTGPLLIQSYGSTAELDDVRRVASAPFLSLVAPRGGLPRLRLLASGRYHDDWLRPEGTVVVWPRRDGRIEGTLRLELTLPADARRETVVLRAPGYRRTVAVAPGRRVAVEVPVAANGAWTLSWESSVRGWLADRREVGVQAPTLAFVEDDHSFGG